MLDPSSMRKLIGGADLRAEYVEYSRNAVVRGGGGCIGVV